MQKLPDEEQSAGVVLVRVEVPVVELELAVVRVEVERVLGLPEFCLFSSTITHQ